MYRNNSEKVRKDERGERETVRRSIVEKKTVRVRGE